MVGTDPVDTDSRIRTLGLFADLLIANSSTWLDSLVA
jgi:hypothetical protein